MIIPMSAEAERGIPKPPTNGHQTTGELLEYSSYVFGSVTVFASEIYRSTNTAPVAKHPRCIRGKKKEQKKQNRKIRSSRLFVTVPLRVG